MILALFASARQSKDLSPYVLSLLSGSECWLCLFNFELHKPFNYLSFKLLLFFSPLFWNFKVVLKPLLLSVSSLLPDVFLTHHFHLVDKLFVLFTFLSVSFKEIASIHGHVYMNCRFFRLNFWSYRLSFWLHWLLFWP